MAIANAFEEMYPKTFWARVRQKLRKSQVSTHFPATGTNKVPDEKIGVFRNAAASKASNEAQETEAATSTAPKKIHDLFQDDETRILEGFNRRAALYVGKVD